MTYFNYIAGICVAVLCLNTLQAQTNDCSCIHEDYGNVIIGAGLNIVHDDGLFNGQLIQLSNKHFTKPFYLSVEYVPNKTLGLMLMGSTNTYKAGKQADGMIIQNTGDPVYTSLDLNVKFYFRNLLPIAALEPYGLVGLGYTHIGSYQAIPLNSNTLVSRPAIGGITFNLGAGFNYWLSGTWGLTGNLVGELGLSSKQNNEYKMHHMQVSFGVFYTIKERRTWR